LAEEIKCRAGNQQGDREVNQHHMLRVLGQQRLLMSNGFRLIHRSLNHNGRGHFRVDGAEVRISSGFRESERKLFIGIENLGLEDAVRTDDGVRDVVVIDPGDRGPELR